VPSWALLVHAGGECAGSSRSSCWVVGWKVRSMTSCGTSWKLRYIFTGIKRSLGHAVAVLVTTVSCQRRRVMWVTHAHSVIKHWSCVTHVGLCVHITDLILSGPTSAQMTSFHLNCDWSQLQWAGSCTVKRPRFRVLRPTTVHSVQLRWSQTRWDEMRSDQVTLY